jgi:hypothetical protein
LIVHRIKINGVEYTNVSSITPSYVYEYYYDVKTINGNRHRKIKNKRRNYSIVFFNVSFEEYDRMCQMLLDADTVVLEVSSGTNSSDTGEFFVNVSSSVIKGLLEQGYYHTALTVSFERVL